MSTLTGVVDAGITLSGVVDAGITLTGVVDASVTLAGVVNGFVSSGEFVGAYDSIPSIAAAYGNRRMLSAYTSNLLRLRRSNDNAELDFGYVANGDLDTAAIATWLGGANGFIVTRYDQSGNARNTTQTTAANQPLYVVNGQNGKPVARFDGVNDRIINASLSLVQPLTINIAAIVTKSTAAAVFLDSHANQRCVIYRGQTGDNAGKFAAQAGDAATPMTVNSDLLWHVHNVLFSGASSNYRMDGVSVSSTSAGANGLAGLSIGNLRGNPNPLDTGYGLGGDIAELVIANAAWSTAEREAAESSANSYWSIY